jgi:2-amino-4-hydroxy-6-hydroxymethyldihydropteridine diphosphokinase
MELTEVFLGLGGNIGDTRVVLGKAVKAISTIPGISELHVSRFYQTSPVSDIPQNAYINAACRLRTNLSAKKMLLALQKVELSMGKLPKAKNAPRILDIDILFFGQETHSDWELIIPHPRWSKRLFVLIPLLDLTEYLLIPPTKSGEGSSMLNLKNLIDNFSNQNNEKVICV